MYIRNITSLHGDLKEDEELTVFYRSGAIGRILKSDKLETLNGDLKVTRTVTSNRCIMVIDTAEVERVILGKGD